MKKEKKEEISSDRGVIFIKKKKVTSGKYIFSPKKLKKRGGDIRKEGKGEDKHFIRNDRKMTEKSAVKPACFVIKVETSKLRET